MSEARTVPTLDPAASAQEVYAIDPAHSEALFQVRHLVTRVGGRFKHLEGTIHVDRARPEASTAELAIEAATIDTNLADRDQHLRSADFFDVDNHPRITFRSSRVKPRGGDDYEVTGQLQIRGVAKEVTVPVTFLGFARDPWGNEKAGFEATLTLNRKDFGMVWNAVLDNGGFILGDDVKVTVNLETVKKN